MNQKTYNLIFGFITFALIGALVFFSFYKKTEEIKQTSGNNNTSPPATLTDAEPEYVSQDYGFKFILPNSWAGYSVIEDEWEGYAVSEAQGQVVTERGPLISLRNPDWEYKAPRQDIPIMVFSLKQWSDLQADKFHIGAAPVNPKELGRNTKYVFALPARYNFSYLTGYEEVEQIINNKALQTF